MKYRSEWKGRVKVSTWGTLTIDDVEVARIRKCYQEGAKSPGGMVTGTIFVVDGVHEFASMTLAIEHCVEGRL